MNVTEKQKKILLDFMKEHEDMARGRLRYNGSNKKILDNMWVTIFTALNSVGSGPQKQPKEWQKTWRDWKSNVLKKCASDKMYAIGTGGGPPRVSRLSQLDEDLLAVIGPESAGLQNIPEGGNLYRNVTTNRDSTTVKTDILIPQQRMQEKSTHNSCQVREIDGEVGVGPSSLLRMHDSISFQTDINKDPPLIQPATQEIRIDHFLSDGENIETQNAENVPLEHTDTSNKRRKTNAVTAVNLMRDQLRIKREKLELYKEKLQFEKEKFEAEKEKKVAYYNILREMNNNLVLLRQEIEKITPQHLE